jgi:hypothetical protein
MAAPPSPDPAVARGTLALVLLVGGGLAAAAGAGVLWGPGGMYLAGGLLAWVTGVLLAWQ